MLIIRIIEQLQLLTQTGPFSPGLERGQSLGRSSENRRGAALGDKEKNIKTLAFPLSSIPLIISEGAWLGRRFWQMKFCSVCEPWLGRGMVHLRCPPCPDNEQLNASVAANSLPASLLLRQKPGLVSIWWSLNVELLFRF